jgi:hypothetical protein
MDHDPAGHPARPARFDRTNVAVGAVVTAVLVSLLGAGPIAVIVATPREEGANIGGGMLAILSNLLAVGLGAAFTTRLAVRRNEEPQRSILARTFGPSPAASVTAVEAPPRCGCTPPGTKPPTAGPPPSLAPGCHNSSRANPSK